MSEPSDADRTQRHRIPAYRSSSAPPQPRPACLLVMHGQHLGHQLQLTGAAMEVGRSSQCELHLDEECISRRHARFDAIGSAHRVTDLGSTNGTWINDRAVETSVLQHGDTIQVGRTILKYLAAGHIESVYHEEIHRLVTTDGLTGLANRRAFDEMLVREFSRARRYGRQFAVLMVDIDRFKAVNDTFGHLAGDAALRQLGAVLRTNLRRDDVVARFGGEEFGVILPEIEREGALMTADKLRRVVGSHAFQYDGATMPLTVSVGVATLEPDDTEGLMLLRRADELLFNAKSSGRNRVVS